MEKMNNRLLFILFPVLSTLLLIGCKETRNYIRRENMEIRKDDKVKITNPFYRGISGTVIDYELWKTTGLLGYNLGTWKKYIVKIDDGTLKGQEVKVNENEVELIIQ